MDPGIDATVELVAELDALSATSDIAARAPRSKELYSYIARGLSSPSRDQYEQVAALTSRLIARLGIWWSPAAYSRLPVMTPWCVRDRSCRYDQGPESWGAPREDGFLRDDNSIIKKLPLPVIVSAPTGHRYAGRKPLRGFTACHVWRELPDGTIAGEDPWLYSFMPNLVWLPSWLAPLTDRHESHVQELIQRTSAALFRGARVEPHVLLYAEASWRRLPPAPAGLLLQVQELALFEPDAAFFKRRIGYLDKFVAGCDSVQRSGALATKLICTRYTHGLPQLEPAAIAAFARQMRAYRDAARESVAALPRRSAGAPTPDDDWRVGRCFSLG